MKTANHPLKKDHTPKPHDPRLHQSRLSGMVEPEALCVTICTPAYAHMREEAVAAFRRHFGLPVLVIECADSEGYETKMKLDLLVGPRKMVFCDLDFRPIRSFPPVWQSGAWCAVRDHGHKHPSSFASYDIEAHGLDALSYFNSGFFTCDLSKPQHAAVFSTARIIWQDVQEGKRPPVGDFGDQFYLNAAVRQLGISISLLPVSMNWLRGYAEHGMFPYVPRVIYAVHAAGVPLTGKLSHLLFMEQAHGYAAADLCDSVAREHLALSVELA
ncbi:MAG: hypothetical protein WAW39_03145 [Prosthecobacter sp.]|uniref:hypothetical protein n=1 Tax=Prosthecobacter sp. TaxID=1965333 RepID=UPI003BB17110